MINDNYQRYDGEPLGTQEGCDSHREPGRPGNLPHAVRQHDSDLSNSAPTSAAADVFDENIEDAFSDPWNDSPEDAVNRHNMLVAREHERCSPFCIRPSKSWCGRMELYGAKTSDGI